MDRGLGGLGRQMPQSKPRPIGRPSVIQINPAHRPQPQSPPQPAPLLPQGNLLAVPGTSAAVEKSRSWDNLADVADDNVDSDGSGLFQKCVKKILGKTFKNLLS